VEIVGVVADVKAYSEDSRYDPALFESVLQQPQGGLSVLIQASAPAALAT